MTLKQISLIIAFGLLFFSVVADCYASDSASGGIVHLHKISKTHRPNAPSNIDILCEYNNGILFVFLPQSIEYVYLSISSESGVLWEGYLSHNNETVDLSLTEGFYSIECVSDGNHSFVGELEL